jgi:hypothetical protein
MALAHLIFDGVPERFADLKIFAAHGGGYLPAHAARMDHAWHAREDCRQKISAPPTSYLKRVYLDTVVFSIHQLEYLIRQYGADHVLLGTDYPYDMGESDPVGHVERVPGLSAAERRATATTTRCGCSSSRLRLADELGRLGGATRNPTSGAREPRYRRVSPPVHPTYGISGSPRSLMSQSSRILPCRPSSRVTATAKPDGRRRGRRRGAAGLSP